MCLLLIVHNHNTITSTLLRMFNKNIPSFCILAHSKNCETFWFSFVSNIKENWVLAILIRGYEFEIAVVVKEKSFTMLKQGTPH